MKKKKENKVIKKSYKQLYTNERKNRLELENKLKELELELEKLTLDKSYITNDKSEHILYKDNINERQCTNDQEFWKLLISQDKELNEFQRKIEYLLLEFGTKEPCNRFDIGNSIEYCLIDVIESTGLKLIALPNAKRFDISVCNYKKLSIKYSSCGDITLHNSNSCINKDLEMKDTILLTPDKLYLITNNELNKHNINIKDYIQNNGDSLKLKRKILKELEKIKYPYIYGLIIKYNKKECKNRLCSKIFYDQFIKEYKLSNK